MPEPKTKKTAVSVDAFLNAVADAQQRPTLSRSWRS